MARKNYSDEFRRQAVDLYESTPGATVRGIADDLGIERGTLRHWLDAFGTGKKTAADGTLTRSPLRPTAPPDTVGASETPEQEVSRLQARVNELEAETTKLVTEREILRRAAKYFAGETAGEPLPVRCRPPRHLRGEAVVPDRRDQPVLVLRLAERGPDASRSGQG